MKIFGREPVVILAAIAVFLKLLAAYGIEITETQQTLLNTFLACGVAVVSAIVLKTGAVYAAILQLSGAALALFLGFGLEMSAEQQAGWMSIVAAVLAVVEHREVEAPVPSTRLERTSVVKTGPLGTA
jgi:predicted amino acid-binding ACT domain protein